MKKYDTDENYQDDGMHEAEEIQREEAELDEEETGESSALFMNEHDFQSVVSAEIEDAVTYIDTDLSPSRAQATAYYRGDP